MRSFHAHLDGEPRLLRYTLDDREAVEALFPRQDNTPGAMGALVRDHLVQAGSIQVQAAILWGGLRHLGTEWTIDRIKKALAKATQEGGIRKILDSATNAIASAGILGIAVEIPDETAGKAEAPASASSGASTP